MRRTMPVEILSTASEFPRRGVVCVILRLAPLLELCLVTDGRTDKHKAVAYTVIALRRTV